MENDNFECYVEKDGRVEIAFYKKGTKIPHRLDGPAIKTHSRKEWWINGKRHRVGGPAIEYCNGTKSWWFEDNLHREDGPAIEYFDGNGEWWINGVRLSPEKEAIMKLWYNNGKT